MRIVIVLEGCLLQGVFADAPGCQYAIIDLDTDGVDRDRLCLTNRLIIVRSQATA